MKQQAVWKRIALFAILVGLVTAQTKMSDPLPIDMTYDASSGTNALGAESISLSFNYDSKKKAASNSASVRPDLGTGSVWVGYQPAVNWGVYCADGQNNANSSNNCQFNSAVTGTVKYAGQVYNVYPNAAGYVGFSSSIKQQSPPANLNLISAPNSDNSPLKEVGILGLSPVAANDFWSSINTQYSFTNDKLPDGQQNDFSFSLMYYLYKDSGKWDGMDPDTWKYSTFWANGWDKSRVDGTKPTVAFKHAGGNANTWSLGQATLPATGGPITGTACLYNGYNSMFILQQIDATNLKKWVCNGQSTCAYDTSKLPNISLAITRDNSQGFLNITLTPSDYAYADNNQNTALSVTIIDGTDPFCGNNKFGLGRLFFAKTLVYFSIGKGGSNPTIYLSQMLPFDKITSGERIVLFLFGLVLILSIIGTVVYKATKKEDADGYREANNA